MDEELHRIKLMEGPLASKTVKVYTLPCLWMTDEGHYEITEDNVKWHPAPEEVGSEGS